MKTSYKYIKFKEGYNGMWFCYNKKGGEALGMVEKYNRWKAYVFSGNKDAIFDASCLRDIAHFLEQLDSTDA